jgi:cyclopropane fatty-acyl-phospholipid synthase-like methyltransferase
MTENPAYSAQYFNTDEYEKSLDPWGYEKNPSDAVRRQWFQTFTNSIPKIRTLDIGAGVGFISRDIITAEYVGLDISQTSTSELNSYFEKIGKSKTHKAIKGSVLDLEKMHLGTFDFIISTGVFYEHYLGKNRYNLESQINTVSTFGTYLLTIHIADWPNLIPSLGFIELDRWQYPYREFTHELVLQRKIT